MILNWLSGPARRRGCFTIAAGLAFTCLAGRSHGAITIHATGSILTSSQYPASSFDVYNLFDAAITEADIDQLDSATNGLSSRYGAAFAVGDPGSAVLVFDLGATLRVDGMLYAQRVYNFPGLDDFETASAWVESTDPGAATLALAGTLGTADAAIALQVNEGPILRRYDFGGSFMGRYVVLQFDNTDGNFFPGGHELRFFAVPEPASAALLLVGIAGLFALRLR